MIEQKRKGRRQGGQTDQKTQDSAPPAALRIPRVPQENPFAGLFFGVGEASARSYSNWMRMAEDLLSLISDSQPYSGASPELLHELLEGEICPKAGVSQRYSHGV